jgi:RraA family protein
MSSTTAHIPSDGWPAGFALNPRVATLSEELLGRFKGVPSAHASDCMGRHSGGTGLLAYHNDRSLHMCGPAITVRVRPGDNLMIHAAMMIAEPGDVLVVDGGGDRTTAVIGGLMRTTALARKLGGIVVDGLLRDVAEWAEGGFPVYAIGHGHRGPSKDGPGEVNVPVAVAGMQISPGDLVLGDADGVVCIAADRAAVLVDQCLAHARKEEAIRARNATGLIDRERFFSLLRAKGCPV